MSGNAIQNFITRWSAASASERANSQLFLSELCDVLEVPRPQPTFTGGYAFEFPVAQEQRDGSVTEGRIDLYKRGCFVLESKQFHAAHPEPSQLQLAAEEAGAVAAAKKKSGPTRGTERWDDAMFKARGQAERYIRSLPQNEPSPPFLIVVDVGDTFEIYADFTQAGKAYLQFPDSRTFRLRLADLERPEIRERLRTLWTNPFDLDPARKSAAVTREIAGHLAELAKSLEQDKHSPQAVAEFLSRCLFCMFAEDVALLPERSFTELLHSIPDDGAGFEDLLRTLFREMNTGTGKGISVVLRKKLLYFNGGLFADDTVLPVNGMQLGLLRAASRLDWKSVEPAIFGTLLERALNPHERHKLGAHYTPRAYVERLVLPTVVEPVRAEWENVRAAALTHARADKLKEARAEILTFHQKLCQVRVLDPACGSGNFLYVTLEHLKRLEGEVLDEAAKYGENFKLELEGETVDPHQFLGIEINPRAASITELVLWIGYLQWHFRTHGKRTPREPVLRNFHNIECRDAVLAYDGEPMPVTWAMARETPDLPGLPDEVRTRLRSSRGNETLTSEFEGRDQSLLTSAATITVWDRRSFKTDLVTTRDVPDETKRVPLLAYQNPRAAEWPQADYVVGNPPFLGKLKLREATGDGYAETLRETYPAIPESADFVLFWWHKAAELARQGLVKRFGLITTNSLRQSFARRVVDYHMKAKPPLALCFAVPDHPWVDTQEGAAVRIAMTVGLAGPANGELWETTAEIPQEDGSAKVEFSITRGLVHADLTVGTSSSKAVPLKSNSSLTSMGVALFGRGFVLEQNEAIALGANKPAYAKVLRKLRNGKDLLDAPRETYVIDFTGLTADEARKGFPELFQVVLNRVKPERDANRDPQMRERWWLPGRSRQELRAMLRDLSRYVATVETAKHRIFQFLETDILPEHKLIAFALDDAFFLGVLSSRIHVLWSLARGALLEDRPVYPKTECFDPFPFPDCAEGQKEKIRRLAEELDAHRKRVQAQHPGLTLTGLYNVLEKLRAAENIGGTSDTSPHLTPASEKSGTRETRPSIELTPKENQIHEQGLVSVLKQLHDDLDAAVFAAYGWPTLTDAEILERVVALNAERAREEAAGLIRWLRPEYQTRGQKSEGGGQRSKGKRSEQSSLDLPERETKAKAKKTKRAWPKTLAERVKAVSDFLRTAEQPLMPEEITQHFSRAKPEDVSAILETLVVMGQARKAKEPGRYLI